MGARKDSPITRKVNEIKTFQKTIVEGKDSNQIAKEMGLHPVTVRKYRQSETYRNMAIAYLDDRVKGGALKKSMCKLMDALDATKPHNKETKNTDGSTKIEVEFVADTNAQLKSIQEIQKIYGTYAPQKRDITVAISFLSDEELFAEIDEAQRVCKYVDSYEEREGSFELAPDPQGASSGDFKSRKRALLQGSPVPQP